MKSKFFYLFTLLFTITVSQAQDIERLEFIADSLNLSPEETEALISYKMYSDSIENTFNYIYDRTLLGGDVAKIIVPKGYKFLDKPQAQRVLSDIWGNPVDNSVMGLLLKEDDTPVETSYAIEISYAEEGLFMNFKALTRLFIVDFFNYFRNLLNVRQLLQFLS